MYILDINRLLTLLNFKYSSSIVKLYVPLTDSSKMLFTVLLTVFSKSENIRDRLIFAKLWSAQFLESDTREIVIALIR